MRPFQYVEPASLEEASAILAREDGKARIIAGGSDLLDEVKDGLLFPEILVSLSGLPELKRVQVSESGMEIGAMVTISQIANQPHIVENYQALAQAAAGLATPQIRNVGTLGGNLNQRPRCWYYRSPLTHCLKKGGDRCLALEGNTKYLCVTGGERCFIVHPSDTAVALTALKAGVAVAGPGGRRRIPIDDYFSGPGRDVLRENVLEAGEVLAGVIVPGGPSTGNGEAALARKSCYLKAGEREAGDFALASAAVSLTVSGMGPAEPGVDRIEDAGIALGGVAPIPHRAVEVEEYLKGRLIDGVNPAYAAGLALKSARPLPGNAYKVPLARNLLKRALVQLLSS